MKSCKYLQKIRCNTKYHTLSKPKLISGLYGMLLSGEILFLFMHCDVIITYCWNRVGYNILRSLSSHGLKVIVADTSTKNICSLSKYNSGYFIYPDPFTEEDAFIECLVNKINELQPKVLLPIHDESVVIMRNRHRFPHDLVIPYVHERLLLEMADKAESSQKAQSLMALRII